ncbi:uncharacterized protein LOC6568487 [Drosophila grimshawi]|uniref:GH17147 n=1 Tax=Drosophila grimshawi TaxID=7222 RepID=B4JUA3_DROGR|nr:uncharacterized protein LOC6568487 [Drosophila grimshawi]EDV91073.1 GH17147 [Drosophila grimshawi]
MYFASAISHSRLKWFGIVIVVTFIVYCLTLENIAINGNFNKSYNFTDQIVIEENKNESKSEGSVSEASAKSNESPHPLYYVYNDQCKIPYIDPFAKEALDIYKPLTFETCTNESDLIKPYFDLNRKRYVLQIDENVAAKLLNSSDNEYNCYYQEITRNALHDSYNHLSPRIYFSQGYVVPFHVQGMIVACSEAANATNVLQTDAYAFIQYKERPETKSAKSTRRKPSVIMFGIDSMSKINIRRTMPKVFKYLTRSGWHEMQGYNKVADNTFPNLMAILSGYTPDTEATVCDTNLHGCFDRFPFIWKDLHKAGYLTAYAEDYWSLNTFNYIKPGFLNPPTDYYYRPMIRAFAQEMESWKCADCSTEYCIGRRLQSSYVYDYGAEFTRRYVNERPIWGLFWSTSFSHDSFELPSKMADHILQYLKDFERDGVFEQSIVIFFSDHGSRFGKLMSLGSGFLEERLPMMFIYLPPWFRAQYPEYVEALSVNQNQLTSNFDLHNTLKHIIEIGAPNAPPLRKAYDCPKCQSLFYPVNRTRTCADAGIPEHYCTCKPYKRISYEWSDRIAPLVIDRINEYLWGRNMSSLCANLTLSYIHKTEVKMGLDLNFHEELPKIDIGVYRTKFKVKQNSADFFATVMFNNITGSVDVDVETISRTNSYDKDSTCINDKIAKLYCICLSDIKDTQWLLN